MATVPPRPKVAPAPAVAGSAAKAKAKTVPARRPAVPAWSGSGPQLDLRQPKTPPERTDDVAAPSTRPSASEVLEDVNQKEKSGGATRQPGGRGARPWRPSQQKRETSRSFERLADRLGELRESETRLKHDLGEARLKLDDLNNMIAARDAEIAQLQQTNAQLDSWNKEWQRQHQSLVASLPDAGQWKMLYEGAEKSRAELQATMQTMQTDHRKQMDDMSEEIKAREASRRRELVNNQVEQLKAKDRELTQLKQEVLEKEVELEALKAGSPSQNTRKDRQKDRDRLRECRDHRRMPKCRSQTAEESPRPRIVASII